MWGQGLSVALDRKPEGIYDPKAAVGKMITVPTSREGLQQLLASQPDPSPEQHPLPPPASSASTCLSEQHPLPTPASSVCLSEQPPLPPPAYDPPDIVAQELEFWELVREKLDADLQQVPGIFPDAHTWIPGTVQTFAQNRLLMPRRGPAILKLLEDSGSEAVFASFSPASQLEMWAMSLQHFGKFIMGHTDVEDHEIDFDIVADAICSKVAQSKEKVSGHIRKLHSVPFDFAARRSFPPDQTT
jgi:hypothetical protein